eukprot:NODE_826_length_3874_cov_0.571656.p2 type:complete len:187 gc:universal NODE_826_length_3874_cov_0.571656:2794-2234(-)
MSTPITLKIVVVGLSFVGKSSLILRFLYDSFVENYDPTKSDSYKKSHIIDGITYTLEILDTAGQESFSAIRDNYYKHAQGFLLIYDVTSKSSFEETEQIFQHIERVRGSNKFPCVLVGNKSDLVNQIPDKDLDALLRDLKIPHQFTSAKENNNVVPTFDQIARIIIPTIQTTSKVKSKKSCKCILM